MAEKTGGPLGAGTETPQVRLDMDDLSAAFDRAVELVSEERRRTGGFPDIGARLPVLFQCAGLADVRMSIFQHMELAGVFQVVDAVDADAGSRPVDRHPRNRGRDRGRAGPGRGHEAH